MKLKTVKMTSNEQIQAWKDQLPSDLTYGTFDEDFDVEGVHYEHGAWNSDGDCGRRGGVGPAGREVAQSAEAGGIEVEPRPRECGEAGETRGPETDGGVT